MFIDKNEKIAGQPSVKIRDFFKYTINRNWTVALLIRRLHTTKIIGIKILSELHRLGYIEEDGEDCSLGSFWNVSPKGRRLAYASAAKPILRQTAEIKVCELLNRAEIINGDPKYLYRVKKVALFGSILTKKEKLNDIDIAVFLENKYDDPEEFRTKKALSIERARKEGRRFKNFVYEACWPRDEIFLFLKSRSRSISIHTEDDTVLNLVDLKIIYEDGERL